MHRWLVTWGREIRRIQTVTTDPTVVADLMRHIHQIPDDVQIDVEGIPDRETPAGRLTSRAAVPAPWRS